MSLTRKALAAMGIEEAQIDQIIEMHTGVTNELKEERDKYKADAEKLPTVQKELNELKENVAKQGDNPSEEKYNELKKEFDEYKEKVESEKTTAKKESAYRELLKKAGILEKRIDTVVKASKPAIDAIEFDKDGNVEKADEIVESIKTEWDDLIPKESKQGAKTDNPPTKNNGGGGQTKEEIMAIKDRAKRREMIAENPDLFGIAKE